VDIERLVVVEESAALLAAELVVQILVFRRRRVMMVVVMLLVMVVAQQRRPRRRLTFDVFVFALVLASLTGVVCFRRFFGPASAGSPRTRFQTSRSPQLEPSLSSSVSSAAVVVVGSCDDVTFEDISVDLMRPARSSLDVARLARNKQISRV